MVFPLKQVQTLPPQNSTWLVLCLPQPLFLRPLLCPPTNTPVPTPPGVTLPTLLCLSRTQPSALPAMAFFLITTPSCISNLARLYFPLPLPSILCLALLWALHYLSSRPLTAQPRSQPHTCYNPSSVCSLLPSLLLIVPHSHMQPQYFQVLLKELFNVNVVWSNTTRGLPVATQPQSRCPHQNTPYRAILALALKLMCPTNRTPPIRVKYPVAHQQWIHLKGSTGLHNSKRTQLLRRFPPLLCQRTETALAKWPLTHLEVRRTTATLGACQVSLPSNILPQARTRTQWFPISSHFTCPTSCLAVCLSPMLLLRHSHRPPAPLHRSTRLCPPSPANLPMWQLLVKPLFPPPVLALARSRRFIIEPMARACVRVISPTVTPLLTLRVLQMWRFHPSHRSMPLWLRATLQDNPLINPWTPLTQPHVWGVCLHPIQHRTTTSCKPQQEVKQMTHCPRNTHSHKNMFFLRRSQHIL